MKITTFKIAKKGEEFIVFPSEFANNHADLQMWDYTLDIDLNSVNGITIDRDTNEPRNRTDEEYAIIKAGLELEETRKQKVETALIWDHIQNRQGDEKWLMDQDGLDKIKTLFKQARVITQGLRQEREFHDKDDVLVWKLRHEYVMDDIDQIDKIVNHIEFFDKDGNIVFTSHDNIDDKKVSLSSASRSDLNQSARKTSVAVLVQRAEAKKDRAMQAIQNGADPNSPDIQLAIGFGVIVEAVYNVISDILPLYYLRGHKLIHKKIDEVLLDDTHPVNPYLVSPTGYFNASNNPILVGEYLKDQFYPR